MCERLNNMPMEINELYKRLREEGRSAGHAQWIIGNYYLTGRNVEKDPDKAEEWFLKAWDHHFPGTANTQAFVLKRQWDKFIAETYPESPRMLVVLSDAKASSDERHGTLLIPVHNDAQKEWIDTRIEQIKTAFQPFSGDRFRSISITVVIR